jgi:ferredoxin-NADP reductase
MLLAIAGTVAPCMVVLTSVKKARRRLRYESWHLIHLYGYLGAGLALPHQLWTGTDFVGNRAVSAFWWTVYAVCLAAVLVFRVGVPLVSVRRHRLRVLHVHEEAPGVTTVTVGGRRLSRLAASGGQFFHWRFLDGPGWTRANPYSLSAAPDGRTLRFTAAHAGDGSSRLSRLRPGTRVLVEGPYGRMHAGARTRRKVLLMGAGIGITPMRALLEDLPQRPGEVTIVHRVSDRSDLVLDHEIDVLARRHGARYVVLEGHRPPHRDSWLPAAAAGVSDSQALRELCPDVAERDVYLCGAPAWMDAARRAAREAGVPATHIHLERFSY